MIERLSGRFSGMNKKLYKEIYLKDFTNGIKENAIFFVSIIFASALISLSLFLLDNSFIQKQLVDSIPIEYRISNADLLLSPKEMMYFSNNAAYDNLLADYKDHFENFNIALNDICNEKSVETYKYNLVQSFYYDYDPDDWSAKCIRLFSMQSIDFVEDHLLEIIDGNVEDIYHTFNGVIVSSNQIVSDEEGQDRKARVGDIIHVNTLSDNSPIEFEVVAIYKSVKRFDFSYGEDDLFVNSDAGIMLESEMMNLLLDYPEIYYHLDGNSKSPFPFGYAPIAINSITFTCKDLEMSELFEKKLDVFKQDMSAYSYKNRIPDYNIVIIYPEYESALNSISRIRNIYILIFIAIIIMCYFLFYSLMSYCQNKRRREIFIYESLGKPKKKIYLWYIILYLLISIPASFFGSILGVYLSNVVNKNILDASVKMQMQLLRYSNNGKYSDIITDSMSFPMPSLLKTVSVIMISVIFVSATISIMCYITTKAVFLNRSRNVLRGGD